MHNPIKDKLAQGQASIGSWLNLASPMAAEVMAAAGFEWLVVDAEHSTFDLGQIAHTFRAIEARGAIPMCRTWDHDPITAARLLDAGAWGLVFPHISTPEQAEKIAQAMRYPPRGLRSVGTGRCVTLAADYRQTFDDAVLCIPQIEDMEGINNAEAIADMITKAEAAVDKDAKDKAKALLEVWKGQVLCGNQPVRRVHPIILHQVISRRWRGRSGSVER